MIDCIDTPVYMQSSSNVLFNYQLPLVLMWQVKPFVWWGLYNLVPNIQNVWFFSSWRISNFCLWFPLADSFLQVWSCWFGCVFWAWYKDAMDASTLHLFLGSFSCGHPHRKHSHLQKLYWWSYFQREGEFLKGQRGLSIKWFRVFWGIKVCCWEVPASFLYFVSNTYLMTGTK